MKNQIMTLLFGLATLANAALAQGTQRVSASAADPRDNSLTVQNDRKVPVTVYLEYGEFDRRLGIVPAMQMTTLALPTSAVRGRENIRLFVHPDGEGEDLASQEFELTPPARLALEVPPRGGLKQSSADTMTAVIPPEEQADATLTVDNPRDRAVTVFAEQGDFDVRLGQVPSHSRVTLRFPRSVVRPDESIRIFVHPDGGVDLSSETMQIRRGAHLGLRVPPR
jgi:hypothetical protein